MNDCSTSGSQSHGTHWVPWRTLSLCGMAIGLFLFGSYMVQYCAFDKSLIAQGQYWRIISGQFVHFNFDHLFWDVLAFTILGMIIEKESQANLLPSLIVSSMFVGVWMILGEGQIDIYYGLSGALNGWLMIAGLTKWDKTKDVRYLLVILGAMIKIAYEIISQRPIFIDPSVRAVPSSHAAGLIGGLCYYVWMRAFRTLSTRFFVTPPAR